MSDRPTTHEALPLIEALLDGTIDDAGFARLEAILREDPQARALYRSCVNMHTALPGVVGQSPRLTIQIADAGEQERPLDTREIPHAELMSLMIQLEAKGQDIDPMTLAVESAQADQEVEADPGSISTHDMLAAGSYLLRHTFTPKVVTALAAMLILGLTLLIALSGIDAPEPVAEDNSEPGRVGPALNSAVATLTAERNAAWDLKPGERLRPGTALTSGQQLTLTQGSAEITTKDGAIAVLVAPATIELLDNDNAIRLHTGKLVGICETASSKGFVVRTPHMDITDLGTRFGVDATQSDMTSVHVLEGVVRAALPTTAGTTTGGQTLSAGQAVRASAGDRRLVRIEIDRDRFAMSAAPGYLSAGTGFGLAYEDIDPNWRVLAVNGQPITAAGEMQVVYPSYGDPASSRWLLVPKAIQPQDNSDRTVTCGTSLQVPATFDARTSQLVLAFNADFIVKGIRVNGSAVEVPENMLNREAPLTEVAIHDFIRPGRNDVEVDIYDRDSHTALRAAFELRPQDNEPR